MADQNSTLRRFASIHVLVVEDDVFSVRVLTRMLEGIGVRRVTAAGDGAEALEALAAAANIDLVICDIEMPRMDGYEFVRRLRYGTVPGYKTLPVLMLTGRDTERNVKKARIHKINGFIVKPPKPNVLERHMRKALGE